MKEFKITNTRHIMPFDKVREADGEIGVVYHIYSPTTVSLYLRGYEDDNEAERDFQTNINDIKLILDVKEAKRRGIE